MAFLLQMAGLVMTDTGQFTCKNSSVVDYFVMSPHYLSRIRRLNVSNFDPIFSDCHNLVECTWFFALQNSYNLENPDKNNNKSDMTPK